jgi:dienelactone hydrolase
MLRVFMIAILLAAATGDEWPARIRETLRVPAPLPALAARVHGTFEPDPEVRVERVSYETALGMRVPAVLYLPKRPRGRIPGLVVVNGHGGDKSSWYAFYSGILYARGGAAVLTYDPIGEGERNADRRSGTRAHDRLAPDSEPARAMGGLMQTDVAQAVSYLASRPEVDPGRIGAMGYSMGSFVLALAGAIEPRLRAVVLAGGGNLDGPGGYWDGSKPTCQGIPYRSLSFLGDRPAALYALHARRGPTLVVNGLEDTVVAIPRTGGRAFFEDLRARTAQRALADRVDPRQPLFETLFVEGASHRPFFVTRPVALWLDHTLDLPAWSDADIRALPETRISGWAKAQSVDVDPLYSSEEREGGTPALGSGIPGLSPARLRVYEDAEWQREKDRLTLEGWVARLPHR